MDEKQCPSWPKFYACAQQYHLGNGRYGQTTHQRETTPEKRKETFSIVFFQVQIFHQARIFIGQLDASLRPTISRQKSLLIQQHAKLMSLVDKIAVIDGKPKLSKQQHTLKYTRHYTRNKTFNIFQITGVFAKRAFLTSRGSYNFPPKVSNVC